MHRPTRSADGSYVCRDCGATWEADDGPPAECYRIDRTFPAAGRPRLPRAVYEEEMRRIRGMLN